MEMEKSQPERLVEYEIWFDEAGATIISKEKDQGYARIDKENAQKVKSIMTTKQN